MELERVAHFEPVWVAHIKPLLMAHFRAVEVAQFDRYKHKVCVNDNRSDFNCSVIPRKGVSLE